MSMKTVRDACQLQPNALSIKLSDQIEQLDELITVEGDGAAFFEKTHITQGMQDLISEGIARLAGVSSQAIFHLKQAMGGGKTHLLVGFGLLAKHSGLRETYCAGMPHASSFTSANIAAYRRIHSRLVHRIVVNHVFVSLEERRNLQKGSLFFCGAKRRDWPFSDLKRGPS
jgi:hypothetical protein